jgi:biopolymer transport protein ExbD
MSSSSSTKAEFLNLTPFIDLFSTLIIFLIMAAAWNQIEALSTNVESATTSSEPSEPNPQKKVLLAVTILDDRIEMSEDENSFRIPLSGGEINAEQILQKLAEWRTKYPDRKDMVLNTANTVPYKHLVKTFDTIVGGGWPDVGVNTQ